METALSKSLKLPNDKLKEVVSLKFRGDDDDGDYDEDADSGLEAFLGNLPQIMISIVMLVVIYSIWKMIRSPVGEKFVENLGDLAGTAVDMLGDWRLILFSWMGLTVAGVIFKTCATATTGFCKGFSPGTTLGYAAKRLKRTTVLFVRLGREGLYKFKSELDQSELRRAFALNDFDNPSIKSKLEKLFKDDSSMRFLSEDDIFKKISDDLGDEDKKFLQEKGNRTAFQKVVEAYQDTIAKELRLDHLIINADIFGDYGNSMDGIKKMKDTADLKKLINVLYRFDEKEFKNSLEEFFKNNNELDGDSSLKIKQTTDKMIDLQRITKRTIQPGDFKQGYLSKNSLQKLQTQFQRADIKIEALDTTVKNGKSLSVSIPGPSSNFLKKAATAATNFNVRNIFTKLKK